MNMTIDVQHLPIEGKILHFTKPAEDFEVLRTLAENGECRFLDPLSIQLTVVPERNLIRVDGVVATRVEQTCSRCLADFKADLKRRFTVRFAHQAPAEDPKELELSSEHIGLSFYTGETIDLTGTVQEQVVLALPYKPLCREECKGLCPRCGADLNVEACGCAEDKGRNPFAVLRNVSWPNQKQER